MPSRKAVTPSGNSPPAARRRRSIQSTSVLRVASKRRAISSLRELAGELHGREPRPVQDLVRVGVADPAQDRGIGEEPLEGVVLAEQRGAETPRDRLEHLDPAGVVLAQRGLALDEMDGRPPPGPGLGHDEGAGREVERGEPDLAGRLRPRALPVQAAGDHEMQHQEEIARQLDDDPLAESREAGHRPACGRRKRRFDRAEREGTRQADAEKLRAADAGVERLDVDGDVGQLRQSRYAPW